MGCYDKVITHTQMGFVYIYKWYKCMYEYNNLYRIEEIQDLVVVGGGYLCAPIKKKTGFFCWVSETNTSFVHES